MVKFIIPLLSIFLFPAIWVFVCFILSRFAWSGLASNYRTIEQVKGIQKRFQSSRVNFVSYKSILTYTMNKEGLGISVLFLFRPFHPPLFIPWDQINIGERSRLLLFEGQELIILPNKVSITVDARFFDKAMKKLKEQG